MKNYLVKAYGFNDSVRIYSINSTALVSEAQKIHDLWPTSSAAFGRLITASVVMGAMYKNDQELTIRVESDGPIGGMLATADANGNVKGYVGNNHVFLQYASGKLNVSQAVGNGFIHVTKDLKVKQPFTSSSKIQTGEIAEDFAYYFTSSEQIPSAVGLGVLVNDDNTILASGGFILQALPGIKEEQIKLIEKRISDLPSVTEMIHNGMTPEDIVNKLTDGDFKLLEKMEVNYHCDCSKEKFEKGLIALGPDELKALVKKEETIETTCHFCNSSYIFSKNEISKLLIEMNNND
jgi:molecular chaperone Hsp33